MDRKKIIHRLSAILKNRTHRTVPAVSRHVVPKVRGQDPKKELQDKSAGS